MHPSMISILLCLPALAVPFEVLHHTTVLHLITSYTAAQPNQEGLSSINYTWTEGEVLHNDSVSSQPQAGDLLLADLGAETPMGWAADVTRTWLVSGHFSSTQQDIYDIVLAAHDACITKVGRHDTFS